ncbi:GNAT family N-acetyltransferase [Chitinophaga qingshengii]|uniref:GNAT family N-acetyltransferase n=2 Tax=Chitinophaga qingshengii TaxID=1569794 RepID=A0ABR7TIS7_9BACT|nr:GNAT family N-acetyltransferase [Chitinophaga qingshengii]
MTPAAENITIQLLEKHDALPYDLLLLADPSREMIDAYVPHSFVYVALMQEIRIGVYVLTPLGEKKAEVKNIAIHETWQGRGLGKQLLTDAAAKARELGFEKLVIGTGNSSVAQLYLYQRSGFEITEIRKNFFLQHYPEPIYENGIPCKHMIMLEKQL